MAKQHLQEDEAARYVLGQLAPAEQHEFETELAQSAELRALVQELEEGTEALARAVPQRPPPPQTWAAIERAITQAAQEKIVAPAFWSGWWRNGWAAAAACLIGWSGYALWTHRGAGRSEAPGLAVTATVPGTSTSAPVESNRTAVLPNVAMVATANANRELGGLRQQVVTLRTQVQHLTHVVVRQQAILIEPGRFKMFPLATNATSGEPAPLLSPELQRALFYAMARELGWLPATVPGEAQSTPGGATNHLRVDFVDLNTPTNHPPATAEDDATEQVYLAPTSVGSSGNIPGFITDSKDPKLVMAFDASIVTNGSPLSFWLSSGTHDYQWIGTTVMSDTTTVVTIPASAETGWILTVTAGSVSGASNIIGQFFAQ